MAGRCVPLYSDFFCCPDPWFNNCDNDWSGFCFWTGPCLIHCVSLIPPGDTLILGCSAVSYPPTHTHAEQPGSPVFASGPACEADPSSCPLMPPHKSHDMGTTKTPRGTTAQQDYPVCIRPMDETALLVPVFSWVRITLFYSERAQRALGCLWGATLHKPIRVWVGPVMSSCPTASGREPR